MNSVFTEQSLYFFCSNGSAPVSMVREIVSVEGVRGLYRGLPGIWVKEVPGSFIYFGSYEAARALFRHAAGDSQMHLSKNRLLCLSSVALQDLVR